MGVWEPWGLWVRLGLGLPWLVWSWGSNLISQNLCLFWRDDSIRSLSRFKVVYARLLEYTRALINGRHYYIAESLRNVSQLRNWQGTPNLLTLMAVHPTWCHKVRELIGELWYHFPKHGGCSEMKTQHGKGINGLHSCSSLSIFSLFFWIIPISIQVLIL